MCVCVCVCIFPENIYSTLWIKVPEFSRSGLSENFPVSMETDIEDWDEEKVKPIKRKFLLN